MQAIHSLRSWDAASLRPLLLGVSVPIRLSWIIATVLPMFFGCTAMEDLAEKPCQPEDNSGYEKFNPSASLVNELIALNSMMNSMLENSDIAWMKQGDDKILACQKGYSLGSRENCGQTVFLFERSNTSWEYDGAETTVCHH